MKRVIITMLTALSVLLCLTGCSDFSGFQSNLPITVQRSWIGPEYWANPLQDWQIKDGRIECITSGGDRNVFLLTHEVGAETGAVELSVRLGQLDTASLNEGWVGFKIGVRGEFEDYRDSAVRGDGLHAGLTTDGRLFIGRMAESANNVALPMNDIKLTFKAKPAGESYVTFLAASDPSGTELASITREGVSPDWLVGGVALVCSRGKVIDQPVERPFVEYGDNWGDRPNTNRGGNVRFWFTGWQLSGSKVKAFPERTFGPILFAQYTLSNGLLKLTAQMAPVGDKDDQTVQFQIKNDGWSAIGEAKIDPLSRTATFRIENWDTSRDTPYRLVHNLLSFGDEKQPYTFEGSVRKEPWDKEELVIAGFTGNNDLGFPNDDIFGGLKIQDPDFLFFSGDQIYEGVAGYGVQRSPFDKACLDYLRKWYLYGWAYGELLKDRPTVAIPDDHDVYHGNLWGAGGIATPPGLEGKAAQDTGGYKMHPEWVNMVQRTQTSHLPDAYDPTPIEQNIGVYYCNVNYAGVSFAVLEDRKFKSPPQKLLPKARVINGWAQNRNFNAKKEADAPGAILLGERQLKFLYDWAADWRHKTWMKVALSQTIFANVATLPEEEAYADDIVPQLRILNEDEYPPNDIPVADMDSNGWPQSGRDRALKELMRAFAFHLAGDQHLGSTIHYGVDDWHDAALAFCVPAISNVWPRRWYPKTAGLNRRPGAPPYTGDFEDGFGNKITVHAVSNPIFTGLEPSRLYDRATGYGIVRLNRTTREITFECWPRLYNPAMPEIKQYPGWPLKFHQLDNYGRKAAALLPKLEIDGMTDPVVQIIDEANDEIVYTLRIKGTTFQPRVFKKGTYTVKVGDPDIEKMQTFDNVIAQTPEEERVLKISF